MADCDILVVGAGHNALVCAGYLAQAGYRVTVVERRPKVGGAVVTEEHVPGFHFDLGGSAHILINHTPIVQDLRLADYGLDYIDLDPLFFMPYPDDTSVTVWRDVERTCENIAKFSPEDAENYRQYIARWLPMSEGMVGAFLNAPTPLNLARYLAFNRGLRPSALDELNQLIRGYGQILRQSFAGPQLPALIGWMAAQSGPPPTEPFSAPFALWHPMYHVSGMKRPRGGSGMLTQALARMIEAHGGQIITGTPIKRLMTEQRAAGPRVIGAETADGQRITAGKAVISGAHIRTTMQMLGEAAPPKHRDLIDRARIGNGFGMVVRFAVEELPDYTALPIAATANGADHGHQHIAMQFICPDLGYLERAYADYLAGRPSREPALISMTWSAADPSLAPEGKHVMFLWGQYYPYELTSGESWEDLEEQVTTTMLATLRQYAPNMTDDKIIGKLVETPLFLERELGLHRGNVMHLEMSVDQMFLLRPAMNMSTYRGPVQGLYLTGASTHPGGGIMGAAGRNAAAAVLHDLSRRRLFGLLPLPQRSI
ncbi:MAG: NAD(P)/FAD-dependent oxidoreductase [Chloroflexi bacterium]|nr:NAD(P)/FAD-dependent oxidoreductase [Chloroflexota bacterium]